MRIALRAICSSLIAAIVAAGCAALASRPPVHDPEAEVLYAVRAWRAGDYRAGRDALLRVANGQADRPLGRHALLALAAAELDPRNPNRRVDMASSLAARYLHLADSTDWAAPVAETIYLLALEFGAPPGDSLPKLPTRPIATRLDELAVAYDSLSREWETLLATRDSLARHIDTLERRLAERELELERIRRTLRQ
jgi:hypothetical protein